MSNHRPCPESTARQDGMSLVEVMIGTVIVVAFLAAVLSLIAQQSSHRKANVDHNLAVAAALANLERVRGMDFAAVPGLHRSGFDVLGIDGQPGGLLATENDPDGLPGEFAVSIDQTGGGITLYRITATVRWQDGERVREIWLDSLVGERK